MSIDFDKARKLASTAIECMDLDGVIDYATDRLTQYYLGLTKEEFELDWADYFPSEVPSDDLDSWRHEEDNDDWG